MKLYIIIIVQLIFQYSNCFIFSVILSIYNTGRYLDESIGSIIYQTIGLKKIQIILIDDGSTDNSGNICLEYNKKYKHNIIYIRISHSGVSKARNVGLRYATGEYINFLDSDDKWSLTAFKYVLFFFNFYKNIDIIGGRIKYFESSNKFHFLDYKFKKTRIVNLNEEYNCIHLHSSSSFFRRSSILGNKFDEEIYYGEDAKFIANNLLFKPIIGFVKEAIYYYRKRADSTSAIQNTEQNPNFYFTTIMNVHIYLINKSKELFNHITSFIQFYLAYEMIFRISSPAYKYLDLINYNKYIKLIENIISEIDDKYILEQKIFSVKKKLFILSIKYKRDIRYDLILNEQALIYSNYTLINFYGNTETIVWRILEIKGNIVHFEGEDLCWLPRNKYFYFARLGDKIFFPKYHYYSVFDFITIFGTIIKGRIITFDIIINNIEKEELYFYISYMNKKIEIKPSLNILTHLPPINNSYYFNENFIIKNNINKMIIFHYKKDLHLLFEQNYFQELKRRNKKHLIKLRERYNDNINISKTKKIWLINDKKNQAGDNGEYFFRYLNKLRPKELSFYFIIEINCSDYKRLKTLGNILNFNSSEHLKLFLKSDKIISSVYDSWVSNPFYEDGKFICDLYHFDLIYLQNGIIKDDLSKYLNKDLKNFNLLITSSEKEYKSLIKYNYGYNIYNIALTGLPRFDNLISLQKSIQSKKIILLFPTWRIFIKGTIHLVSNENIKSDYFKNTTYFKYYNQLINDINLLEIMKKNNYIGIFCLHQNFAGQLNDFDKNEIFDIKEKCNNQELFVKASLLITDYSSIFLDFGYIKKPVIYTQFDYEEYRAKQLSKGYFNYERYGFGPICYNMECTLKEIILYIANDCKLKKVYNKRIRRFFRYIDDNNSYRTYKAILQDTMKYDIIKYYISLKACFCLAFIFIILKMFI